MINTEIKVFLTIKLEGSTLVRKRESRPIHFTKVELGKPAEEGETPHFPLEAKDAALKINLTKEAFIYMISSEVPQWEKAKDWVKMPSRMRLISHLKNLCEHHHGVSYSFVVLPD